MKKVKQLLVTATTLITVCSGLGLNTTSAYAHTGTGTKANDPKSWNQVDQTDIDTYANGKRSWTMESCMIQAAAFVKVKTGAEPIGYSPKDLKKELDASNAYSDAGFVVYSKINWGNDWEMVPGDNEFGYTSASYDDVVDAWNQGYLVVMRVQSRAGAHQIAVDHIDSDGTMYIFDSGYKGLKFTDTYSKGDILNMVRFKSKSGRKASELPTLYNNPAGKQIWARTEKDGQRAKQQAEIDEDNRKAEEARLAAEKQAKAEAAAKESQDNLQKAERTNKLKDVDAAVSKAERTKDKSHVAYAHVKVSELSDVLQQDYLTRLNKIK